MYAELARKRCKMCLIEKPINEFYKCGIKRKNGSSGYRTNCKTCQNKIHNDWVEINKDRINANRKENYRNNKHNLKTRISDNGVRYRFALSTKDYSDLLSSQNNVCAICKSERDTISRRFDVDHDHETKKIRGLLCVSCNRGIGLLKDSIEVLGSAITYLAKSKK